MVQRKGGFRKRTRYKMKKPLRQKGKISLRRYFQKLEVGDKVQLLAEPAYHKGMYFPRFHGSVGTVKGSQGVCYNVEIRDNKKKKELIVHPVHLKKM
ncbi:50S ribosomal protein L21e [Candidatus Woesearchaeota archaeon]|nr:50S ribosomal protein L21e [Candidatus Woesearchaeota archaeon]